MREFTKSIFSIAVLVIAVLIARSIFGEYTIKAYLDEKQIESKVTVDGKDMCTTPCKFYLMPLFHKIEISPPDGQKTAESASILYVVSTLRGVKFDAKFTTPVPTDDFANFRPARDANGNIEFERAIPER